MSYRGPELCHSREEKRNHTKQKQYLSWCHNRDKPSSMDLTGVQSSDGLGIRKLTRTLEAFLTVRGTHVRWSACVKERGRKVRSLANIHTICKMKGAGSEPAKGLKTKAKLAKRQASLSIYFSMVVCSVKEGFLYLVKRIRC